MVQKKSSEIPGAIQARLTHLRGKKAALNRLIASLERYAVYQPRPVRRRVRKAA